MNPLHTYTIPLHASGGETKIYEFHLDRKFFDCFPESLVREGAFEVEATLDRRAGLIRMALSIQGSYATECGRCMRPLRQAVDSEQEVIIKFGEAPDDSGEVLYVSEKEHHLNIAKVLYDYVCLSLPITPRCSGDAEEACAERFADFLTASEDAATEDRDESEQGNPFLDALGGLDFDED